MRKILWLYWFLHCGLLVAQDTVYYNSQHEKIVGLRPADISKMEVKDKLDTNNITEYIYYASGKTKSIKHYQYKKLHGQLLTYWENGIIKRDDVYEKERWVRGKCFNEAGKEIPHFSYEEIPEFPDGAKGLMKYLQTNMQYPTSSKEEGISGKVYVKFIIETDGSVTKAEVLRGINEELNNEALRLVRNMPKWSPGKQDGEPVRVYFNLPIYFKLN